MDLDIGRAKELITERDGIDIDSARAKVARYEAIDTELVLLFSGKAPPKTAKPSGTRKPQKCGVCGSEGHSSRTCPAKLPETRSQE